MTQFTLYKNKIPATENQPAQKKRQSTIIFQIYLDCLYQII
jgi:hypothetical protein